MSWEATAAAAAHRVGSPARKAVLFAIANHAQKDGTNCRAHIGTIAEEAEVGERTARAAIKAMVEGGVLYRHKTERGRRALGVNMTEPVDMASTEAAQRFESRSARSRSGWETRRREGATDARKAAVVAGGDEPEPATVATESATVASKAAVVAPPSEPTEPTLNRPGANVVPLVLVEPPAPVPAGRYSEDFERWWDVFPNHKAKAKAAKAFEKALKKVSLEHLIEQAIDYADECRRLNVQTRYIAHGATWLNDERWADEIADVPASDGCSEWDTSETRWA